MAGKATENKTEMVNLLSLLLHFFRYIMTSEFTLAPTEKFFKENHYFGMQPSNIVLFEQRMIPAVTLDGKVILQGKGKLAMAPGRRRSRLTSGNHFGFTPHAFSTV